MKYCVHGHFYQPPREEPISNQIPKERGANPFDNWNERICAECYTPNAELGNFKKISFNIGPTLFQWLVDFVPETAGMIVDQERQNFETYGVGNGMAQAYNHSILPLQTCLDKITQVRWGIEEFNYRFGHSPLGMWLPETGVDMETLCVLSDCGLTFTILAPWQIQREANGNEHEPVLIELPGGRKPFVVFPYEREYSTKISFLPEFTENGDSFLQDIKINHKSKKGLTLFASDGELYGHHQHFRDLFLSYILGPGSQNNNISWTYPGLYLKENEVTVKANLKEPSSWSCLHGVGRWTEDCGCTPGSTWKNPMRLSLNAIAEWVDDIYVKAFNSNNADKDTITPLAWELRHRYIEHMLGIKSVEAIGRELFGDLWLEFDSQRIERLLEAQLERQKMFTSCGWFFDDFNRIEPANNIAYAAKAVWICQKYSGNSLPASTFDLLNDVFSQETGLSGYIIFLETLERARYFEFSQ